MYSPFEPTQNNLLLLKALQTWAAGEMQLVPPTGSPPRPPPASERVTRRIVRRVVLWTAEAMIGAGTRLRAVCLQPGKGEHDRAGTYVSCRRS